MVEKDNKERDIEQVVRYLTTTFNKAKAGLERAFRGKTTGANQTYVFETEFAYRLNEVIQGPRCMLQRNIAECNEYIDYVISRSEETRGEKSDTEGQ